METIVAADDAVEELKSALKLNVEQFQLGFSSPHEAYAVLLEEVEELWQEIKKKSALRDVERMKAEALDIAVVALRIIMDIQRRQ